MAHVLDRYHCLDAEGLNQCNIAVGILVWSRLWHRLVSPSIMELFELVLQQTHTGEAKVDGDTARG